MKLTHVAAYQRDADNQYWQGVVRFRWLATAAFVGLALGGALPHHMPWTAIAGAVLTANTLAYTVYRRWTLEYTFFQDAIGFLDLLSVALILISAGSVSNPLWVAYVLVIPAVANFKGIRYNTAFTLACLASFGLAYYVTRLRGTNTVAINDVVVTATLLLLIAVNSAMIAANNDRLRQLIRLQAATDPLTGLANRRRLFEALEAEEPGDVKLAVMMVDLDDFKTLNEAHGHIAGDAMLGRMAEIFSQIGPRAHLAARYGGDEFVVLAHVGDAAEAQKLGESLIHAARTRLGLGISVGIALCPDDTPAPIEALYIADANLSTAKAAGKEQAVWRSAA